MDLVPDKADYKKNKKYPSQKKNYFNIDKWKKFHEDKGVESSKNGEKQH